MVLATWAEKIPDEGWPILKALFDTWFDAHPGRHPFEQDELRELDMYSLRQIAEKSPTAFIKGTIDALLRSIEEVNRREETGIAPRKLGKGGRDVENNSETFR